MNITTIPLFVLMFGIIFVGAYAIADDFTDAYGTPLDDRYNKYGELIDYDSWADEKDQLKEITTNRESQYFTGVWDAVKRGISITYGSYEVALNVTSTAANDMGVPVPVISMIWGILVILLLALIISLIGRAT